MPDQLRLHVNRQGLHSLEVPDSFETHDSFDVVLVNHGEAVHVHLHLDDGLAEIGSLEANNHYVQANTERTVRVTLDGTTDVFGKLKVVTSYGATTRYVDVEVVEPDANETTVRVDESLSKPQPAPEPQRSEPLLEHSAVPVLVLAAVAILLAALAVAFIQSTAIKLGAVAVIGAVVLAAAFLLFE